MPTFHRLLKKHDVDFQEMTAGAFKRTVSVFGEITEGGGRSFRRSSKTHSLFKQFVKAQRPKLELDQVAPGCRGQPYQAERLGIVAADAIDRSLLCLLFR